MPYGFRAGCSVRAQSLWNIPTATTLNRNRGVNKNESWRNRRVNGAISSGGCSPTGLAVGGSTMLVGCGNAGTQAVLLKKSDGSFIKTIPGLGGTDEIWFDPTTGKYYVTGNNGTNTTRFFDVVNEDGTIAQTVNLPATTSAHSITVDPFNGDVFVPL